MLAADHRAVAATRRPARIPPRDGLRVVGADVTNANAVEQAVAGTDAALSDGRVLRARTPDGVDQEIHALLIVYQLLRTAMVDATDSRPGLDPDRASFTTALNAARDQLVHAAGVIADTAIDLVGVIGQRILANLLPQRRLRIKTRMIKRSNSKYQARGTPIDRHTYKATTSIDVITNDP